MLRASALFQWLLPLSVLLLGVSLQLARPWPVEFAQNLVFDQYNRWQPRLEQGSPVVFVDIDEDSLKQIGQFPWPRQVFAELVTRMADAGAATITFDILFAEKDRTAPNEILPFGMRCKAVKMKRHGALCAIIWPILLSAPIWPLPAPLRPRPWCWPR